MVRGGVRSLSLVETPCLLETFSFLFFFFSLFHSCFLLSLSGAPTTAGKKLHDMYIVARGEQEFILLICFGDRRNWKERTRVKERLQPGNGT